jgi:hypothetical protein
VHASIFLRLSYCSTLSKAIETDFFPLAFAFDDIDIIVRCDIAAAAATGRMLSQLVIIITFNKKPGRLFLS